MSSQKPWPPPPDLASLKELVATADVEGFLADGAPQDEYDTEAEELHSLIEAWPTAQLAPDRVLPVLVIIWQSAFSLDELSIAPRLPALTGLAEQIARFFGPEAQPQVRTSSPNL